ncbi:hypothetical protein FJV41_13910 [Myxococcus llanfairpwllgwyngyllgogerychwyrndrobwllllantysiliogogogochensis]|uniref:Lipoprotein n=1 Tax=Myxococcus llanfairpwllgwyngyllgogerychwyrndrobwllllantysiliogogogochensis TaxID=2590453 RepID=A0A540X256_9BACT|nr:hypothetical protein [Myxococcus llanfairpwllgwyngyllgogerychwyrndrobwllllantysiliogogogochensis]TQF15345.1 hypothetical protein FJV41_13910 [Myxococcus llanfairpwllgwyngyllgogerychwyrndrobwllllantysiliogogogochensis]
MMRRAVVVAALCGGLGGTGCVSVSHVQTADTLGAGKFQIAIEPGVGGAAVIGESGAAGVYYPHIDLAARFGVTERLDLGVRFGSSLAELQSKFLLTTPDDPNLAISLAPSVMGVFVGNDDAAVGSYVNLAVPLLVGFKTAGGSELVLGPRVSATRIAAGSSTENAAVNLLSVGASVGYALRVTEGFRLMPEVGISVPIVGEFNTTDSSSELGAGFEGGFVQFKLGFLFGRGRSIRRDVRDYNTADSSDVDI